MFDPDNSTVTVDGEVVSGAQKLVYFMFHKPSGYLTTFSDPQGRPTIKPFLDQLDVRIFPVGRLDMDVSGLLILTNDGELNRRLMHPSFMVPKIYHVQVKGIPDAVDLMSLRDGRLTIDGKPAAPAKAEMLQYGPDKGWLELTLTEGRHRQVKRMCSAIGHPTIELKRVAFCGLWLPSRLKAGQMIPLTGKEISKLKNKVGLTD
jgi:pseudouridine synthase